MKLAPDLVAGSREFTADKIRKSCLPATLLTADCLPSFRVFKFPSFQVSASDSGSHGALLDFWPFNWRIKCSGEALATWNLKIGALWNPLAAWSSEIIVPTNGRFRWRFRYGCWGWGRRWTWSCSTDRWWTLRSLHDGLHGLGNQRTTSFPLCACVTVY